MESLFEVLRPDQPICLMVHNNPDPDALASAMGLQYLLKKKGFPAVRIYYDGFIGRAENKAMLSQLKISTHQISRVKLACRRQFVLLDCQPFAGNVTLPEKVMPLAVIDHHPLRQKTKKVPFYDVRPGYGACSTIIYEYLVSEDVVIPTPVATALFHAIFSETQGLGREGSPADKKAYLELLPRISFKRLSKIQYPSLSRDFISNLLRVLTSGFYYKHLVGVILEELPYPDFVAEMADFLLRIKKMSWSICLGSYQGLLYVSIRSKNVQADTARLIKRAIPKSGTAGGHELIAGARVRVDKLESAEVQTLKRDIVRRVLRELYHADIESLFNLVTNEPVPFSSD
ncbi:MAG TPA: DHH family phosphoesterase [Candidatus Desulfaltia sp.]|nr:DHH family phosphoesterase [Candidatus Desulfaltia sp.]